MLRFASNTSPIIVKTLLAGMIRVGKRENKKYKYIENNGKKTHKNRNGGIPG